MQTYLVSVDVVSRKYSLSDISNWLKVPYSKTSHEISSRKSPGKLWSRTVWRLESPLDEKETLERHLKAITSKFPFERCFRRGFLPRDCRASVNIGVFSNQSASSFEIDPDFLEMIGRCRVGLEVAFYRHK